MNFDFNPTTRVLYGEESIEQVADLARNLDAGRVLLVTDPGLVKAGHAANTSSLLNKSGFDVVVFKAVHENPTTAQVEAGVRFASSQGPIDSIIALGGGSVMDCAKGINLLLTNGGELQDYEGKGKAKKELLPAIGIPTTAGTGSEAQSFALIADDKTHRKAAYGDIKIRFDAVILDPLLLLSVPPAVRAVTGMDAISHAIESFVSKKRNALSQMFSREAWRLLEANYEVTLDQPDNIAALGAMLLGAHFAGAAIENAMLGAAHACANPLTARFGITHGIAVGLMLPHVIKFNGQAVNGDYARLLEPLSLIRRQEFSGASQLAERVFELRKRCGRAERLRDFDIREDDLPELAADAAQQWTGGFNPRPVAKPEMLQLYRQAF